MILEIKIPSPGESITEAQLSTWLVKDGDYVEKDQELAEIESDKATLPLIAPDNGQIKMMIQSGETVKIGAVACTIDTTVARPTNGKPQTTTVKPPEIKAKNENLTVQTASVEKPITTSEKIKAVKISPIAQKIMEEHGLTSNDILNGLNRISKNEVEAVIELKNQGISTLQIEKHRDEDRKKMSPLRKKLSERLVAVKNQTAMLTTFNEVDMSTVMDLRKKYQSQFEAKYGFKIGFMSFFTKAVSLALKLHPNVNSMIDGEEIVTPNYYD
ncbi:MAG TPA: 2-oxo acid dehydrogenase subunit E2, partial [Bacteroidales bacterium]